MGTPKRLAGPAYLAATATDVFRGGGNGNAAPLIRDVVTHIRITNKTAGAVTASLYVGATGGSAGGTEVLLGYSVAANGVYDWYGRLPLLAADYLSGLASAATSLTITVEGYQEVI